MLLSPGLHYKVLLTLYSQKQTLITVIILQDPSSSPFVCLLPIQLHGPYRYVMNE